MNKKKNYQMNKLKRKVIKKNNRLFKKLRKTKFLNNKYNHKPF